MIKYSLPDFTSALGLNLFFARLERFSPQVIRPGVKIDSIYGCFPQCNLNGGRAAINAAYPAEKVRWTFDVLAEYGLTPRLTLTNMLGTVDDLDDPYTKLILEQAAAANAQAIVYSPEVGVAIRERYGLSIVLSTTHEILTAEALNAALEQFDIVVLNYNFGKDADFLAQVRYPEKLEVMVNEYCQPACPRRQAHYMHNSRNQRDGKLEAFDCPAKKPSFFSHPENHPILFTAAEAEQTSRKYGIEYFKIVGRGTSFEANLEALTYYLVRPEFHARVKQEVLRQTGCSSL